MYQDDLSYHNAAGASEAAEEERENNARLSKLIRFAVVDFAWKDDNGSDDGHPDNEAMILTIEASCASEACRVIATSGDDYTAKLTFSHYETFTSIPRMGDHLANGVPVALVVCKDVG